MPFLFSLSLWLKEEIVSVDYTKRMLFMYFFYFFDNFFSVGDF